MEKETIRVFDFDGTLTTSDTLLAFIRFARGRRALAWALLRYSPLLVLMRLRLIDNGRMKERVFAHFFRGMSEADFNALCEDFGRTHTHLLRPEGLKTIRRALRQGERVVVLSASIDRWVEAILRSQGVRESRSQDNTILRSQGVRESRSQDDSVIKVMGTEVEVVDGRLTGRFATPNCYGAEKVRRLQAFLALQSRKVAESQSNHSPLSSFHSPLYKIIAYGDSRGDRELLAYADEAHYKPFRVNSE